MTITFKDLLHGHSIADVPHTHEINLQDLQFRVNMVLEAWNEPVTITSGYRSKQDQLRIYRSKGVPDSKIPMGSCHLVGKAVDIYDPDLRLTHWLQNDPKGITILEQADLYCEAGNADWVHFQTRPTKNRWFKP